MQMSFRAPTHNVLLRLNMLDYLNLEEMNTESKEEVLDMGCSRIKGTNYNLNKYSH